MTRKKNNRSHRENRNDFTAREIKFIVIVFVLLGVAGLILFLDDLHDHARLMKNPGGLAGLLFGKHNE